MKIKAWKQNCNQVVCTNEEDLVHWSTKSSRGLTHTNTHNENANLNEYITSK